MQPVLDRHCVSCHSPKSPDAAAAKLDLTAADAYKKLLAYADGDLRKLAFERDRSIVGRDAGPPEQAVPPVDRRRGPPQRQLPAEDRQRLATWMDTYAHRIGHFDERQEQQLREFRERFSMLPPR